MLSSYRQIFAAPGSLAFSSSGLIARLPISMTGIGIVTMLSQLRGSYGVAGAVSAVLALSAAALGPQVSRLVDRYGQRRVTLPAMAATIAAAIALLLCAHFGAPTWTLFVSAAAMGVMPSTGSMVRARWAYLYSAEPPKLHTAYSLEAVLDEVCFIVGPILSIGLATAVFPEAGLLLAGVFLLVGILLFTAQRRTEPPVHPAAAHRAGGSAIRSAGLQVLVATFVATGAIFGSVEVVTVAFAEEQGHKAWSSAVLAVYALGSCLAGAVFGTLKLTGSMAGRFLAGVTAMAVAMAPLIVLAQLHGTAGLAGIGAALFLAGLAISPTLITAMALVERLVPAAQLTEGMTWTTTGLALGVALGSSVAGWVVDAAGGAAGYWVPLAAAAFGALVAFAGLPRLRGGLVEAAEAPAETSVLH